MNLKIFKFSVLNVQRCKRTSKNKKYLSFKEKIKNPRKEYTIQKMENFMYGLIVVVVAFLAYFFLGGQSHLGKSGSSVGGGSGGGAKCVKGFKCDGNVCTRCE